jgi:acetyl esterase/lipase
MARLCGSLALLLAVAAAGGGALIFWRPPTHGLELLALVASERSLFLAAGALLALALVLGAVLVGARAPGPPATVAGAVVLATVVLSVGGLVMGVLPYLAARRVAREKQLALGIGRYLRARIDTEGPIRAGRTVTYATTSDGRALDMDVYLPPARPSIPGAPRPRPRPSVLVLHGGGWNAGDKGDASRFSRWLADQGYVVLDVEYRTHPQPNWRQAIGDVACAIVWVRRHAAEPDWNLDPGAITLLGRSAGGHLALLAAYGTNETRLGASLLPPLLPPLLPEGCRGTDTTVAAVIAYYAPTDLVWGHAHPANPRVYDSNDRIRRFTGGDGDAYEALYQSLSPVNRVSGRSPRTLLIHGGRDQLVDTEHMFRLAAVLAREAVPHETLFLPTARHAFDFVVGGFDEQLASATVLRFLSPP